MTYAPTDIPCRCGAVVREGDNHCRQCGASLDDVLARGEAALGGALDADDKRVTLGALVVAFLAWAVLCAAVWTIAYLTEPTP